MTKSPSSAVIGQGIKRAAWASTSPPPITPGISSFIVPQLTPGASAYDNGSSAYTADDSDNIDAMLHENKLVADKKLAEEALLICQESLKRATARIEQQKIQIASLSGRGVAMKIAAEEASMNGKTWDIDQVRRFSVLPKGPPDFMNDALREMLDQAVLATDRRVRGAINEGVKARSEADKADGGIADRLEGALAKCKSPEAEHALRTVTRDMIIQNTRCTKLLRNACKRLEEEAASALFTHTSDLRSMGARLVAQRDAISSCVLDELQRAEVEGAHSMRGMSEEIKRLHGELAARDEELVQLRGSLAETQRELKQERRNGRDEAARVSKDTRILKAEFSRLEEALSISQRDMCTSSKLMCAELEREENERRDDSVALRKEMEEAAADAQARIGDLQGKLKALKIEARTMHANLTANFKSLEREYQQQEAKHALHMQATQNEFSRERNFFEGKIEQLGKKILALRSTTARGRAMLYWTSMKSAVKRAGDKTGLPTPPDDDLDDEDGALFGGMQDSGGEALSAWRSPDSAARNAVMRLPDAEGTPTALSPPPPVAADAPSVTAMATLTSAGSSPTHTTLSPTPAASSPISAAEDARMLDLDAKVRNGPASKRRGRKTNVW